MPISADRLAAVRGGFDLGNGLQVSFGIQRAVYVDGNLVTYINVSIPDIAHITTQQALSLATALSTVNVQIGSGNTFDPSSTTTQASATKVTPASTQTPSVQTGAVSQVASAASQPAQSSAATVVQNALNNPVVTSTIIPSSATQASAATVIQNTVNNQVIRSITTLNVAINALNAMRNQGLQQSLQAAQQLQALSH
ncbi:hypothetical protein ACFONN_05260 [Dyella humi]